MFKKFKEKFMKKKKDEPKVDTKEEKEEFLESARKNGEEQRQKEQLEKLKEAEQFLRQLAEAAGMQLEMIPSGKFTQIHDLHHATSELDHHRSMAEMHSDFDLVEELLAFQNKGYEIPGLIEVYNKLERNEDLSQVEKTNLKNWYILAQQDLVYNV